MAGQPGGAGGADADRFDCYCRGGRTGGRRRARVQFGSESGDRGAEPLRGRRTDRAADGFATGVGDGGGRTTGPAPVQRPHRGRSDVRLHQRRDLRRRRRHRLARQAVDLHARRRAGSGRKGDSQRRRHLLVPARPVRGAIPRDRAVHRDGQPEDRTGGAARAGADPRRFCPTRRAGSAAGADPRRPPAADHRLPGVRRARRQRRRTGARRRPGRVHHDGDLLRRHADQHQLLPGDRAGGGRDRDDRAERTGAGKRRQHRPGLRDDRVRAGARSGAAARRRLQRRDLGPPWRIRIRRGAAAGQSVLRGPRCPAHHRLGREPAGDATRRTRGSDDGHGRRFLRRRHTAGDCGDRRPHRSDRPRHRLELTDRGPLSHSGFQVRMGDAAGIGSAGGGRPDQLPDLSGRHPRQPPGRDHRDPAGHFGQQRPDGAGE